MTRTLNTLIASSPVWTSTLIIQGQQRVNMSIYLGSMCSGVATYSTPVNSTFSGVVTLQRQLPGDGEYTWRDVEEWSVVATDGLDGNKELVTTVPEPETCQYRAGVKEGDYYSVGFCYVRIGTM